MQRTSLPDDYEVPFFDDTPVAPLYKIYNDGGHYIATIAKHAGTEQRRKPKQRSDLDCLCDSLYHVALSENLIGAAMIGFIRERLAKLCPERKEWDDYIAERIDRCRHNLYARKKRFRRKAHLNRWNYFVTFTYDDGKQTEESFRKKLRVCLSHLHTRRGWRYMGVFERAPETGRLHFHGLLYVPEGEMVGTITEKQDYSTAQGRMQTRHENDFFEKTFGRNDFEELFGMELQQGQTLNYLLKYIGKTGERIVYSRGIASEIYRTVKDDDIITSMQDYGTKYILFDGVISWERDVMTLRSPSDRSRSRIAA